MLLQAQSTERGIRGSIAAEAAADREGQGQNVMNNSERHRKGIIIAVLSFLILPASLFPQATDKAKVISASEKVLTEVIKSQAKDAPGCAVGVSFEGEPVVQKAFGLAELEHKVPITVDTIFESGSVAKQFTAAAVVLLAIDGKIDLDDPVRKYIPELPDYGAPMTIRHLLNHTAGLRDWGAVMGLSGVGRGERIVRQDYAIHVITKQKALDFVPGAEYSYSNSGYQLATEIVERVSGKSLPEFTKERIFDPIGMKNTSWRDDYERLVLGRAQAYVGPREGPWKLSMPFMNVYGNGGMLLTIGDFLKWNAALDSGEWQTMVDMLETEGVLNDGRKIGYALGLGIGEFNGHRRVSHGGRTAGYVTHLVRYPDDQVSAAVLCNAPTNNPGGIANRIAEELFGPAPPAPEIETAKPRPEELKPYAGRWRHEKTRMPVDSVYDDKKKALVIGGAALAQLLDGAFTVPGTNVRLTFEFGPDGERLAMVRTAGDDKDRFIAVDEWKPSASDLQAAEGDWYSDEADAHVRAFVKEGKLMIRLESLQELPLGPSYKDHFTTGPGGSIVIWIERDRQGRASALHVGASRLRDIRFVRAGS